MGAYNTRIETFSIKHSITIISLLFKGEGHAKIHYLAYHVIDKGGREKMLEFLLLPFAQGTSFFSAFLHDFNNGSKNSSVVGGAIRDVTTRTYVGISVDGTVKSLCALGCFKSHSEGISS